MVYSRLPVFKLFCWLRYFSGDAALEAAQTDMAKQKYAFNLNQKRKWTVKKFDLNPHNDKLEFIL